MNKNFNIIFFNFFILLAVGSSNTSTSTLHVIKTVTTHVRMKPTFTGRRQIQVNCSNPNINQYTTASTSTVLTTQPISTLEPSEDLSQNFLYLKNTCSVPFNDIPGWTVIQRRCSGQVDFKQTYRTYEKGFGDTNGEIWIGNEWLYNNTVNSPLVLRVDFQATNGSQYYLIIDSFQVGSPDTNYTLRMSDNFGTFYNALYGYRNCAFSAFDADHDNSLNTHCALVYGGGGGFWYDECFDSLPNGSYDSTDIYQYGIFWRPFKNIPFFQMRVKMY